MIHKVAAIVIKNDSLLLVRKVGKDVWTNLGGHIEAGETEQQALLREIKEEINCEAKVVTKLGDFSAPAAFDNDTVLLSTFEVVLIGEPVLSDPELEEFRYITKDWASNDIKLPVSLSEHVIPFLIKDGRLKWAGQTN